MRPFHHQKPAEQHEEHEGEMKHHDQVGEE
jgi:hypothetical protein